MRKKVFGYFIGLVCCISAILCLSACDGEVTLRHMHTFSDEWTSDESNHWHAATCGHTDKISGVAQHTFENDICTICLRPRVSVGLSYSLNEDKTSYSVTGAGTCTDTDIIIPAEYKDLPVTGIADRALAFHRMASITIPDGVTSIGEYAFWGCSALTSVTIPDTVTIIGDSAFEDCGALTSITIPDGVISIGNSAFAYCRALTDITIPDSVTSIGYSAFWGCSALTSITIPDSVTSIGNSAFEDCGALTSITIPDSVTSIGDAAFSGCSALTSITIPDSVTSIGYSTFWGCSSIEHATMPAMAIEAIPKDSLTAVILTSGDSIYDSAFADCSALTSITIPDTVTSIGGFTFSGCFSLAEISFDGTMEQWNALRKNPYWDSYTGDYTVYCTNGEIAKEP